MDKYIVKTNKNEVCVTYDPWHSVVDCDYEVVDVEDFKTILKTENKKYAEYVCKYWNNKRRWDESK